MADKPIDPSDMKKIQDDLKQLQGDFAKLISGGLNSAKDSTAKTWQYTSEKTEDFIKERPLYSVLGAVAVGALIGYLSKR